MRVALRPRGWAPGLLAAGLIGAQAPALAQETIDLATDADVTIQGAAALTFRLLGERGGRRQRRWHRRSDHRRPCRPERPLHAGASYVMFGSDQGFPATIDLASRRRPDHPGRRGGDHSGFSVSGAGDVNGDGIDDLIIGAPGRPERPSMPAPAMWCSAPIRASGDHRPRDRRRPDHPGRRRVTIPAAR